MDVASDPNSRRSLRARTSSSVSGSVTQPQAAGSESPRSDISDGSGRASRSSRLSNPEFAAKHKAFMAKVTAASKGSMDSYLNTEMTHAAAAEDGANTPGGKRKALRSGEDITAKRRRNTKQNSNGLDTLNDAYCWICHKEGEVICCETCPRVFHLKCISLEQSPSEDWVCPECVLIMTAENMDTRSRAMRLLTVDQLCTLLKHALTRMKSVPNSEPFLKPVDSLQFPAYKDYVSCPMDIQSMERNIRRKQYGSTEAMLADCKWVLHNCIIFNSPQSKLTSIAKNIVKVCKHEMQEIENCPDCYLNAHIKKDTWFTEACRFPHSLVWAKLKGFPYWPGKLMRVNSDNSLADIRFFGAHDRAWIALKDVYLFSEKPPLDIKKKRGNLDDCVDEVQLHIKKLRDRFGEFAYSSHKTIYDNNNEELMLKTLFPKFQLPFEIGSLARRARSYSFTGSERSRGETPTPSETSMHEEEAEGEEEEEEIKDEKADVEAHKTVEARPITVTQPRIVLKILKENIVEPPVTDQAEEEEMEEEADNQEDEKVAMEMESPEESQDLTTATQPDTEDNQTDESLFVVQEIIAESLEQALSFEGRDNAEEVSTENHSCQEPEESVTVQSQDSESAKEICHEDTVSDEDGAVTATATVLAADDQMEKVTDTMVNVTERSTISPPCEVTSTTAVDKEAVKTKRIHGVIAGTSEPVIIEDEDPEIDDVEPGLQSEVEEDSNDVVEIQDDEAMQSRTSNKESLRKDTGETSKAISVPVTEEIDDVEPMDEDQEAKISQTAVDPTKLLAAGVSITVIDKKKGETSNSGTSGDPDKESDISVTLVHKSKTETSSNGKFTLSLKRESELLDPEKTSTMDRNCVNRKSLTDEEKAPPDAIITISKITNKDSKDTIVSSHAKVASSPGPPKNSSSPSPGPNMMMRPGLGPMGPRGPMTLGPRGPMLNMMAGQGMMRGQFRGPMAGGPLAMPNLQPRPSGMMSAMPSLPSAAGPVAEQLNRVAGKLADYMRQNLEDLFKDLSQQGSPEATIKGLQLELEKMQWRHQQELAEVKHNADLILMEMRASLEQDKQRAIADCRKQAEIEKQKSIAETKKKQWCANCGKEAIFYCCWNTSYCDYPCQQAHWPSHMTTCAQNNADQADNESEQETIAPQHFLAGSSMLGGGMANSGRPTQIRGQTRGRAPGIPASMAGMRFNMQPRLPGQNFNRPYFM